MRISKGAKTARAKTVRTKTVRTKTVTRAKTVKQKRRKRVVLQIHPRKLHGGNYETDVTTGQLQGIAMKDEKEVVIAFPGGGVMSVAAYKAYMEQKDRDGFRP